MNSNLTVVVLTFLTVLVATVAGVLLFFQPVTQGDTGFVQVHPLPAVLAYVGLCTAIFLWATRETTSAYKAAFALIAPQAALVMDLTLRGERGLITGVAGIALLVVTWIAVALVHRVVCRWLKPGSKSSKGLE